MSGDATRKNSAAAIDADLRLSDDEALGAYERRLPWGSHGMLARASISAPTLELALRRWCRHHGLLTRSLSLDGRAFDIACGQIDIGNAASEMTAGMAAGVPQADGRLAPEPRIDVAHVARAVVQMAALPLDVNVQFMTIMAAKMPFIGRG